MSYNPNIPTTGQKILQSFGQLRANFQAIDASFATNHEGLTKDAEFSGMHDLLTLRPQGSDPTTSATQVAIYNKLVSSIPEMFFRPNSSQTPIQMTYPSIKADGSKTQYSFVAGPFIVYGGTISNPTNGQGVTLTPGTTLLYVDLIATNVKVNNPGFGVGAAPTNISGNSFTIKFLPPIGGGTFDLFYFAIGV